MLTNECLLEPSLWFSGVMNTSNSSRRESSSVDSLSEVVELILNVIRALFACDVRSKLFLHRIAPHSGLGLRSIRYVSYVMN